MNSPSFPFVFPFAVFLAFVGLDGRLPLAPAVEYPLRVVILTLILWFVSRRVIDLRVRQWLPSTLIGIAVFAIWIAPDVLFPWYRQHWLFTNPILGGAPVPSSGYDSLPWHALVFRATRAVILVPIIEELFWRAWLMRWLIRQDFLSVPLGTYQATSFCITALLFAAEHGAYWDVGLLAGVSYNAWVTRTRSLGDCIWAHAVTNACLSAYVVAFGKWRYW
ncbi:MAG: CAAX prenyl protease-related protein [Acidobacteria bacterium]|nr:CAAX prenyl protease-related protein [Acidobacteriota bacterium]